MLTRLTLIPFVDNTPRPTDGISSPLPRPTSREGARSGQAKLVARDEKKNPLISTFDWTDDATKRVMRVPAGFMRNKTQERIEELARERAVKAIDLWLVEDGIELGKTMMAEMISTEHFTDRPHQSARSPVDRTSVRVQSGGAGVCSSAIAGRIIGSRKQLVLASAIAGITCGPAAT
jgi:hypothetical protein